MRRTTRHLSAGIRTVLVHFCIAVHLMTPLIAVTSSQQQPRCPRMCVCRDVDPPQQISGDRTGSTTVFVGMLIVDCRGRSVTKMADVKADLPVDVGELDLGKNEAAVSGTVIRSWFPSLARLRRLRMDHCSIRRIDPQAFRNIRFSIELIDLSHNAIDYVDRNAFREMPLLRTLRLDSNRLGLGDGGLPEMAFRGIELDVLDLSSNDLSALPESLFDGIKGVTSLRLDDNRLATLNGSCLRLLSNSLRSLSIVGNRQPLIISDDAVSGFTLSVLELRRSGIRSLRFIEHVDSVESLDVGENPLGVISLTWYSSLSLNCRQARLDAIGLEKVDGALLSMFRSAVELDLSDNQLATVDANEFRGKVPDLRRLDLSKSMVSRVSVGRLSERLPRLEVLNLSGNALTEIDVASPSEPTTIALRVLDVANNQIQIFPSSLETFFDRLDVVRLAGNPVHCNCESAWLRRWIVGRRQRQRRGGVTADSASNAVDDIDLVRCNSPASAASTASLADQDALTFVCRSPSIISQTPSLIVSENSTVVLSCTADGDPAPDVHWSSPIGEELGVTPPADRRQSRTTAVWSTSRIRRKDAGWYICNASSAVADGSRTGYTYVHVLAVGELPVDLSGLQYPSIPPEAIVEAPSSTATTVSMTSSASVTVSRLNSSVETSDYIHDTSKVTDSSTISSSTTLPVVSQKSSESTTVREVVVVQSTTVTNDVDDGFTVYLISDKLSSNFDVGATEPMSDVAMTTAVDGGDQWKYIAIAIGVGLAVVVLIVVIVIVVLYFRFRNRRHKRCFTRPIPPTLTSDAVCNKYASDDVFAAPATSRARSASGPNARTGGIGGGYFMPGISLAPKESSSSRPLSSSTEEMFTGVTFGGRGSRSIDDPSVATGGSTERDGLLLHNSSSDNGGVSPSSMNV